MHEDGTAQLALPLKVEQVRYIVPAIRFGASRRPSLCRWTHGFFSANPMDDMALDDRALDRHDRMCYSKMRRPLLRDPGGEYQITSTNVPFNGSN